MNKRALLAVLVLVLVLVPCSMLVRVQARPDFNGKWTFDTARTQEMSRTSGRAASAVMAQSFVAEQTADTLTLHITYGPGGVDAVYKLDGTETKSISPGDVAVFSKCKWDADKLIITTTSTAGDGPSTHTVESRRILWFAADGSLVIDRDGTPQAEVP